jgi:uncharacterized protein
MNPKRLRAGKAVEQTAQPPAPLGASKDTNPPAETPETKASPIDSTRCQIPQILFEGDEPSISAGKGLAQKFELGDAGRVESFQQPEAKLPESYGTGRLLLTARDPHTLLAHWDLTNQQQQQYNSLSADGRLALRAYAHAFSNPPAIEIPIPPDTRHSFLHVDRAGVSYVGELGYYQPDHQWKTIATSGPTTTPPDAPSNDTQVVFSTPQARRTIQPSTQQRTHEPAEFNQPAIIPVSAPRWPFEAQSPTQTEESQHAEPLLEGAPPFVKRGPRKEWTPVQERLLAEMIRISSERREWISSAEIMDLIRHQVEMPPELGWPLLPGALVNISSPAGEQWVRKGFWFNINAELIIYGATDPNAQVTLAGRPITLRPDGTFSFHFALPDGEYELSATAVSPENEQRQATMIFSRHTNYSGEVGVHRQDPSLEWLPQPE